MDKGHLTLGTCSTDSFTGTAENSLSFLLLDQIPLVERGQGAPGKQLNSPRPPLTSGQIFRVT